MLLSAIYGRAARSASWPALLFVKGGRYVQLSFGDVVEELERWASRYLALRLRAGSRVAIVLDHRLDAYGAYLGAMRAGLVPTFLAYPTPKQREAIFWPAQREIFAAFAPACVVTYAAIAERIARIAPPDCARLDVDDAAIETSGPLPTLDRVEASDRVALVQLSSGTTAARKLLGLTYGQLDAQFAALAATLRSESDDRTLSWAPLYHDMGLMTAFLYPLTIGSSVVAIDAFEWLARPQMFFELVERFAITDAWLPNFAMRHLVRVHDPASVQDLSSLKRVVTAAESIRIETVESFWRVFARWGLRADALRCAYGLAENVLLATITRPGGSSRTVTLPDGERPIVSVGSPLPGMEVDVRDATTQGVGEIAVRGPCAIDRYDGAAESARDADGWLRTGDLGFFRDGELFVCGRIKEIVIVNGRNFFAGDIEAVAESVAGVKPGRSVAFARYEPVRATEEAVVLLEALDPASCEPKSLARDVRREIASALGLHVGKIEVVDAGTLIKTTSGKMSRAKNAELFAAAERSAST